MLLGIAIAFGVIAAGMAPLNTEWIPAWSALAMTYLVGAHAQWTARPWARGYGLGIAIYCLFSSLQAVLVLGLHPLAMTGATVCALLVVLQLLCRGDDEPAGRHLLSMVLASMAVPCAVVYGLAPQHTWLVTAGVLGGAAVAVSGTWGVCRGRTWGLFASLAGAILITVSLFSAQHAGVLHHPHPILPNTGSLALLAMGIVSATLCFGSALVFLVPIIRFLRR